MQMSATPEHIRNILEDALGADMACVSAITVRGARVGFMITVAPAEKDRGMQPGTIFRMLENDRVPKDTFREQIRASQHPHEHAIRIEHRKALVMRVVVHVR